MYLSTVAWFIGILTIMKFIRKISNIDDFLNPKKRKDLSNKLEGFEYQDHSSWIPDFIFIFDHYFGKKYLSFHFFIKSMQISIFFFFIFLLILGPKILIGDDYTQAIDIEGFFWLLFMVLLINVLIDYLSLLLTRVILSTSWPIYWKIIIDTCLTFIMVFFWLSLILHFYTGDNFSSMLELPYSFLFITSEEEDWGLGSFGDLLRTIIATSYTTSIWLWLHGIAQPTIKKVIKTSIFISRWLNVQEKPVSAIGHIINFWIFVLGITLYLVYLILYIIN